METLQEASMRMAHKIESSGKWKSVLSKPTFLGKTRRLLEVVGDIPINHVGKKEFELVRKHLKTTGMKPESVYRYVKHLEKVVDGGLVLTEQGRPERNQRILDEFNKGRTRKEIAEIMGLSYGTVSMVVYRPGRFGEVNLRPGNKTESIPLGRESSTPTVGIIRRFWRWLY